MAKKLPVKFPTKAYKLKSSGAVVIIHPCCMCGKPDAPFGIDVKLRGYGKSLGYWFCEMKGKCKDDFKKEFPDYDPPKPVSPSVQLSLF